MSTIKNIADLFATAAELELTDYQGTPTGIKLKLVGRDSAQFKEASKRMIPYADRKVTEMSQEELTTSNRLKLEMITSCVVGWNNDEVMGGAYSVELANEVLTKPEASFILDQIAAFLVVRDNFFRPIK